MLALAPRRFTLLPVFSRRWWATWCNRAMRGETTKAMVDAVRRGRAWQALSTEIPSDTGTVAVAVGSPEYDRWRAWWASMGVNLPRPNKAPVIFAPAAEPPSRKADVA